MKDPIEEKYHKQAEELRKELEEESKSDFKFFLIFFLVLLLAIITWFLVGPTKIKITIIVLLIISYILFIKFFDLLKIIGDFFEKK